MRWEHPERNEAVEIVWGRVRRGRKDVALPSPMEGVEDAGEVEETLRREGFVQAGPAARWDCPQNPELEEACRRDPTDRAPFERYAAWLATVGQQELAELIAAGRPAQTNDEAYRWLGDRHDWFRTLTHGAWELGFPRELQVVSERNTDELRWLLCWPLCRFLRRIALCFDDLEPVVEVLAQWPGIRHVPDLALWADDSEGSDLPDMEALWKQTESLEKLAVVGWGDALRGLVRPQLRQLARRSPDMATDELDTLWSLNLPQLEALTLGIGRHQEDDPISAEALRPLLDPERFPSLRRLAIEQFDDADALVEVLAESALLPRLTHVSLYQSALTDAGAEVLRANRDRFVHLAELGIRETTLSDDTGAALFQAIPAVGEHNAFLALDAEPYLWKIYQSRFWDDRD